MNHMIQEIQSCDEGVLFFLNFVQAWRCLPRGPGGARHERSGGNRAGARYPPHHRPPRVGHRLRRGWVS